VVTAVRVVVVVVVILLILVVFVVIVNAAACCVDERRKKEMNPISHDGHEKGQLLVDVMIGFVIMTDRLGYL
jgi:heme/copper-type cytochrome/quinol oxidase subunit 2